MCQVPISTTNSHSKHMVSNFPSLTTSLVKQPLDSCKSISTQPPPPPCIKLTYWETTASFTFWSGIWRRGHSHNLMHNLDQQLSNPVQSHVLPSVNIRYYICTRISEVQLTWSRYLQEGVFLGNSPPWGVRFSPWGRKVHRSCPRDEIFHGGGGGIFRMISWHTRNHTVELQDSCSWHWIWVCLG